MKSHSPYLDLLKRCLLNEVYLDDELRLHYLRQCLVGKESFDYAVYHDIRTRWAETYQALQEARSIGRFLDRNIHNSGFSHTMIGRKRLDGLHACLDQIFRNNVPGDLMECGVWRGGACIFMAGYLRDRGIAGRKVILADSFDGLPPSTHEHDLKINLDKSVFPELAVSLDEVKANFETYGLLTDDIHFLKGWFKDSLQETPSDQLALLRLDGDLYESTMDALVALYDRVAPGGIVIIDDWGVLPACRRAVEDFFAARGETVPEITEMDWSGVWFAKPVESEDKPAPETLRPFKTAFPHSFLEEYQRGSLRYAYRGVPCLKSPIDMAIHTRAVWDLQPGTIIEIGSKHGGSALFYADLAERYGLEAKVWSIDLEPPKIDDPRISFLAGDVNALAPVFAENGLVDCPRPWFVIEDSAHTYEGCLAALSFLSGQMQAGDLLVMEDGVLDELGLTGRYGGGPNRAIAEFLTAHPDAFEIDTRLCDMFGRNATYAPNGYLRKT